MSGSLIKEGLLIVILIITACSSPNKTTMEGYSHTNALIKETSPYLLQHAHNPVNWFPWGEEALRKAGEEGKLIIVSIGYSSCHWCHVMEHESFEDSVVAQLMNDHFISIKVDREERPDIDHIFMTAVQLLNQQGGWPLNCIALPDGRPIWGGTYFPKEQWIEALQQVLDFHRENPHKTRQFAAELAEGVHQQSIYQAEVEPGMLDEEALGQVVQNWSLRFDLENGGNKGAPKFPMPVNLEFLLHYGVHYRDQGILDHVDRTLTRMARGGIYDQVGGGFARYSVDPIWKVPHFEKMLYDNGQLIGLYSRAYQVFQRESYSKVVRQSIEFLKREMRSGEGAFYSALDADSEGEEGKYYVWDKIELQKLLKEDYDLFSAYYNINQTGHWEQGKYILFRTSDPEKFAIENSLSLSEFQEKINQWTRLLMHEREKRVSPGLDDKSLTSWSSMVISALVQAYRALGDREYLDLAIVSASLIRSELWSNEKVLFRNYKDGRHSIKGFHIDYAQYIEACLDLYEASLNEEWLRLAHEITRVTLDRFFDEGSGMFLYSSREGENFITNNVETQDNVIASSNSVMAHNLYRLGHIMADGAYVDRAISMARQMAGQFEQYPYGYSNWGRLLLKEQNPYYEVAVVGPSARKVIDQLATAYLPHVTLVGSSTESNLPLFRERFESSKTRIFVCQDNICQLPVEDPGDAEAKYHIE